MRALPESSPPPPALIDEADAITQATGIAPLGYTSLVLAAWRGQEGRRTGADRRQHPGCGHKG